MNVFICLWIGQRELAISAVPLFMLKKESVSKLLVALKYLLGGWNWGVLFGSGFIIGWWLIFWLVSGWFSKLFYPVVSDN